MANITIDVLTKKLPVDFALNLVLLTNYKQSTVMLAIVFYFLARLRWHTT